MDYIAKINDLRAAKAELLQESETALSANDFAKVSEITAKMEGINDQIGALEKLSAASASRAEPVKLPTDGAGQEPKDKKEGARPFASLGEQLQAIVKAKKTGEVDRRLLEVNNDIKGANEGSGADGGFAVQEDFAGSILETAFSGGQILSRVDSYTVSANANAARWLMVDETDITASVFGGVQMYWAAEGAAVNASKPKFKELKLDLEKMMGFAYATDELLQDASFMSGFFGRAFTLASTMLLEDGVVSGDGSGKPLGILQSGALIEVAKESDQGAGSLVADNILKMWQRALLKNRNNAVWLLHPDLEPELPKLMLGDKLIWMPEGGISGNPYQTILGRPVLYTDALPAQGTKGDILLADLNEYMLLKKGTAKQDWSMHVEFLTDQMCFRMVLRANGTPKRSAPVKIRNSKNTRSPFVTLAARA